MVHQIAKLKDLNLRSRKFKPSVSTTRNTRLGSRTMRPVPRRGLALSLIHI